MKSREQSPDEQRQKVHEANVEYLVRDKLLRQKIQYDLKSTYAEQVRLKKEMEHLKKWQVLILNVVSYPKNSNEFVC